MIFYVYRSSLDFLFSTNNLGVFSTDVKPILSGFEGYELRQVRRIANEVAHRLAKNGCDNKLCKVWVGVPQCMP